MRAILVAAVAAMVTTFAAGSASAETPLERGRYLMNGIVACGNCHTPKDASGKPIPGMELAGGFTIDAPPFRAVAPNITSDKETGIGKWTDAQLIAAIREGKRPDGSIIGPPMPIEFYRKMSDSDVKALVAALRASKPIKNVTEKSTYRIPLPPAYGPPVGQVADIARSNKVAYGRYLADIGHCMECHTPREKGRLDMAKIGGGGQEIGAILGGVVVTSNLTPANKDGIAGMKDAGVKQTIQTGVRPDGRKLVLLMAFDWYKNIGANDMDALVAYLRTLKPVP